MNKRAAAILGVTALCGAGGSAAEALVPTARPSACPDHSLSGRVECFTLLVPENPEVRGGRKIPLEVMMLRARSAKPLADPIFVLPGGPGQSATRSASARAYFAEIFDRLREHRDIVLLAPRGTAGSNDLSVAIPPELLFESLDSVVPAQWAPIARAQLSGKADLRQYTSGRIADDVEQIRRAFGYPSINIYATSYGTRVAQIYARRNQSRVRSLVLKAPLPLNQAIPLTYSSGAERTLRMTLARCAADDACAKAYPDISERFGRLMKRLTGSPLPLQLKHPVTGQAIAARLDSNAFGYLLRNLLMSASGGRVALQLIDMVDKGDTTLAANFIGRTRGIYSTDLSIGMALGVLAAEDAPRVTSAALERERRSGRIADSVADGIMGAVKGWPRGAAAAELRDTGRSKVPTLIVTGDLDPATPPEFANRTADTLANARVVVFPGGAHSGENFVGLPEMISAFVGSADPAGIDASHAQRSQPIPLIVR